MKFLIEIILFLYSLLPNFVAVWWGRFIGFILAKVVKFKKKRVLKNLEIAFPDMPLDEKEQLYTKVCLHFGLLIVEILRLPNFKRLKTARRVTFKGLEENFLPAYQNGKGVSLLIGHIGNWELLGVALSQKGLKLNPIVKELKSEPGNYLLGRIRNDNGMTTLPRKDAVRDIFKALKRGEGVTHVLDQNMTSDEGIFVNFFNKTACTQAGLAVITRKTKAPVLPVMISRNKGFNSYTIEFFPPIEWQEGENEIEVNTQLYNDSIEKMIRKQPDQWIWMHNRWKTQPEK